jgi:hypothetical protein
MDEFGGCDEAGVTSSDTKSLLDLARERCIVSLDRPIHITTLDWVGGINNELNGLMTSRSDITTPEMLLETNLFDLPI